MTSPNQPDRPASSTNLFLNLATSLIHKGEDAEEVAYDLAQALEHIICDGLGLNKGDQHTITAEIHYLLGWSRDTSHRRDIEIKEPE